MEGDLKREVIEVVSPESTHRSRWSWMFKATSAVLALAVIVVVIYGVVVTKEKGVLNTKLESAQSELASTQGELSATELTLASTQSELSSTEQALVSTQAQLSSREQELASTQSELSSTEQTLASTQSELGSTEQTLASTQSELKEAEAKIILFQETFGADVFSGVQPLYEKESIGGRLQINLTDNQIATDPNWQELIAFLLADPTDDKYYQKNIFDCGNFAEMLHNNAEAAGNTATFVAVFFEDEDIGHALNAFKTTDKGLVYVDCTGDDWHLPTFWEWLYEQSHPTEWDKIAYVVKGKEYGVVSIDRATSPEYSFYEQIGKSSGSGWLPLGIVESIEIYW